MIEIEMKQLNLSDFVQYLSLFDANLFYYYHFLISEKFTWNWLGWLGSVRNKMSVVFWGFLPLGKRQPPPLQNISDVDRKIFVIKLEVSSFFPLQCQKIFLLDQITLKFFHCCYPSISY